MAFNLNQDRLAETLGELYLVNFAEFNWARAVIESSGLSADSQSAVKLSAEITGESKPATDNSTGANTAGVDIGSQPVPIYEERVGYKITPQLESIARLENNYNPIALQMRAAFFKANQKLNDVVYTGYNEHKGLLTEVLPAGNSTDGIRLDQKATKAQATYEAIADGMSQVFIRSGGRRVCNTIVMPNAVYGAMQNKIFDANPSISLLEAVRRAGQALMPATEGTVEEFRMIPTYKATTAMRFYDRRPESIQFEIPLELTFADPQFVDFNEVYAGRYRFTPLIINDNEGIIELKGVAAAPTT